jgi:hypothetical protein
MTELHFSFLSSPCSLPPAPCSLLPALLPLILDASCNYYNHGGLINTFANFGKRPQAKAWGYISEARLRGLKSLQAAEAAFVRVAAPFQGVGFWRRYGLIAVNLCYILLLTGNRQKLISQS